MKFKQTFAVVLALILLMTQTAFAASPIATDTVHNDSDSITELIKSIPQEVFGGIYYNEDGNLVLRLKDTGVMPASVLNESIYSQTIVEYTHYSLTELEAMKDSIEPYMLEYGIISLDANEANGTVDIQLSRDNDDIIDLLAEHCDIDPDVLRVTVSDSSLDFTVASVPADSVPEEYVEIFGLNATPALSTTAVLIFPGLNIAVNNSGFVNIGYSYGTAGPRYNSNRFLSAGHLVTGAVSSPRVLAALSSNEIGQVTSYVFGSSGGIEGDRSTIRVTSNQFELPTSNSLGVNGGRYTYAYTSIMNANVEMWGAYSGITTGRVLATNQTLVVNGTTIRNLTKTNYQCRQGDSGAAVFSLNAAYDANAKCYGIQSIGEFYNGSEVATYSYYSPIDEAGI